MRVILDMVVSPNGFIARENNEEDWLPNEGWDDFVTEAKQHNNIVMGRETYEWVTQEYKEQNFDIIPVGHKIIVTRNAHFKAPSGYAIAHSPQEAIEHLTKNGMDTLFLIGGGSINGAFAKAGLIDQIQLTIAPYIIGKGKPVLAYGDFEFGLILQSVERLSLGRIRIVYSVRKT